MRFPCLRILQGTVKALVR